ncbi:MAG: methylmalonyl-CoA mutase [Candidatus Geothermarchaeales archaeon]
MTGSGSPISTLVRRLRQWQETTLKEFLQQYPERRDKFANSSDIPVRRLYTEADVEGRGYLETLGFPGEFPYTRGIYPTMYRAKLWTMRQFSGYGTAEETNQRFRYLLGHGETGLSIAFDNPTLMGYDTDDPLAGGEFGFGGVGIDTLKDTEILFDGIPIGRITTSMTINGPAPIIWAMYVATAEKQGVSQAQLDGTTQNDILKEYIAQNEFIFPPEPSVKLVVDTIEYAAKRMPKWHPVSISGYHIREAGSTAVQELAFTLANGLTYVKEAIERGLDIDEFAPQLSFFFNSHNDFFEEISKFRAARRIWAREITERYHPKNPQSLYLRFHTQTAGVTLTAQQPETNVVRVALQALAAVMGGTQSLHTNSLDEALGLPTEKAVRIALRTQQIIAHESGVASTVDPLGGSYYLEWLTDEMEERVYRYFDRIDSMGGVVAGIRKGFFLKEIAEASYRYQRELRLKERIVVGVNEYLVDEKPEVELFELDPEGTARQLKRLRQVKSDRNTPAVQRKLKALRTAAKKEENLMPHIVDAVRAYATLGEVVGVLREVYGSYEELAIL